MSSPCSLPLSLGSPQIYFWEVQRRNLTERVKTLFLAENSVKLKNLTGYTAYMVSVAAFNAAGDGPRSTPTRGQTQQAGREKSWGGWFVGDTKTTPGIRAVSCSQEAGFDSQAPLPDALQRENPACQEGSRHKSRQKRNCHHEPGDKPQISPSLFYPPCLSFGTSLHSQPLPGFLLLSFVSLSLFIPPVFIIFYEPTLLLHPGDATIREKKRKKKQCLHPSESHGS